MHRWLQINGLSFNVLDVGVGKPGTEPVLLVHGFPDDHTVWRRQVPVLVAAGYRVIAADMRGCGRSEMARRTSDYALHNLVADLAGILDSLGIESVNLIGHDWGAVIAWQFCFAHAERVRRYIALSVGHPTAYARGPLEQKFKGYYVLLFQLRGLAEWALTLGDWAAFRKMTNAPSEVGHWIERLRRPGRLTAAIRYYRANLHLILPGKYPRITLPVMGLFSTGDRFLAEAQMRASAKYLDGPFRFERIAGVGHWLQLEAPDAVNALLIDYLVQELPR